ncbi:hypothetical protein G9463_12265 [Haloarcula sp. JP-Z28]|uniref:hypothetical protein n=1 Tax=Haloarcula sp. JP-Z28 TaxID=2716715 RepID=UPI00140550EE|nr:hypothetical protein [Haloarcula sp. JP-Z28]NHN64070.1 hypothetical protein [Haloarcula sp. JP-Z28]
MARIIRTVMLAGIVLIATTAVGASAFTAATVDRQANTDVVSDEDGLIGLTDGNSGNLVFQNQQDQLEINFENGTALGANTDAKFELGDPANPGTSQAFQVRNNDDEAHMINVGYSLDADDGNTADNYEFRIFDSEGNDVGTVTEEGTTAAVNAAAGASYNVVVVVDTGHGTETLTSTSDLSGTLSFTVDDVDEGGTNSDGN